jgi:hypothetical protein
MNDRHRTLGRLFSFLDVDARFSAREFTVLANTAADKVGRTALRGRVRPLTRALPRSIAGRVESYLARSGRPRPMPELRARLARYFAEDAARLREQTGLELGSWSV